MPENALEACAGKESAYIYVYVQISGANAIVLAVDNNPAGEPALGQSQQLLSTKHAGDGIRTISVAQIAKRYQGVVDFRWADGVFLCLGTA